MKHQQFSHTFTHVCLYAALFHLFHNLAFTSSSSKVAVVFPRDWCWCTPIIFHASPKGPSSSPVAHVLLNLDCTELHSWQKATTTAKSNSYNLCNLEFPNHTTTCDLPWLDYRAVKKRSNNNPMCSKNVYKNLQ